MTRAANPRKGPARPESRTWALLRRFACEGEGTRGVAAIEFALIGTVLVLLSIPAMDFGIAFYRQMQVQGAAQAGAQAAMLQCASNQTCTVSNDAIQDAVSRATETTPSANFSGIAVSPAPEQFCGCPTGSDISEIGSPPCLDPCPDGSSAGTYIRVQTQGTYGTLFPYPLLIPNSIVLSAKATARIQ